MDNVPQKNMCKDKGSKWETNTLQEVKQVKYVFPKYQDYNEWLEKTRQNIY